MKKLTTFLFGAAAMLLALTTTSCGNDGQLSGTYTFDRVYDLVALMKDGSKVSAREMGALKNSMDLFGESLMEEISMETVSFTFSGSNCTMSIQGDISGSGSYTLSGNRLILNMKGGRLDMGYRSSPQPIFIWDTKTFETLELDITEQFEDTDLKGMEIWMAMNHN